MLTPEYVTWGDDSTNCPYFGDRFFKKIDSKNDATVAFDLTVIDLLNFFKAPVLCFIMISKKDIDNIMEGLSEYWAKPPKVDNSNTKINKNNPLWYSWFQNKNSSLACARNSNLA